MSIGYNGIAHLQDYDYNDKIAIYSFDCYITSNMFGCAVPCEDGLLTITYDISENTFISNKGKKKVTLDVQSKMKIDAYSSNCIQSSVKSLAIRFQDIFERYLKDNNGLIPLTLNFTC